MSHSKNIVMRDRLALILSESGEGQKDTFFAALAEELEDLDMQVRFPTSLEDMLQDLELLCVRHVLAKHAYLLRICCLLTRLLASFEQLSRHNLFSIHNPY